MDRRQQKTRAAIFRAFGILLERKNYNHITVQEIIDEANIGRSTFYAHFETKDELLRAMCTDIFHHVFSEEPSREKSHNFSTGNYNIEQKISHILYHLQDNRKNLKGILSSESGELFLQYFRQYLSEMFRDYIISQKLPAPQEYVQNHVVCSFAETVRWWITEHSSYEPEEVTSFFLSAIPDGVFH